MSILGGKSSARICAFFLVTTLSVVLAACAEISQHIGEEVGKEIGPYMLLPAALIAFCWWVASRILPTSRFTFVIGVAGGQLVTGLIAYYLQSQAGVVDSSTFWLSVLGITWLAIGILWLAKRPGLGPVALLGLYEIVDCYNRVQILRSTDLVEGQTKALLGYVIIDGIALIALALCYVSWRSGDSEPKLG